MVRQAVVLMVLECDRLTWLPSRAVIHVLIKCLGVSFFADFKDELANGGAIIVLARPVPVPK